jgi:hypothetical protein
MVIEKMVEAAVSEIKQNLVLLCREQADAPLTPQTAQEVTQGIQQTLAAVGKAAFKTFLEAKEEPKDIIVVDGQTFRFKTLSNKSFTSLWGKMGVGRKLFQNGSDTKTHAPLDVAWGMADEHLAIEVREALGFACNLATPEEAALLFEKTTMFHLHPTVIKRAVERIEACVAPHRAEVDRRIREQEEAPEGTRVLVASMDGVNVLLNEKGTKQGRPAERPKSGQGEQKRTAYKNAMVGSVSFYGEVKEGAKCPERLGCRYVSHMPEEGAVTFKNKFEAELAADLACCPADVAKVLLCDAARPIWNYAEGNDLFGDFEKLIDYWHALEHLSLAAEALFGKGTDEAKTWYAKYAKKLKEEDTGAQSVLRSMAYHAKTRKLPTARRKGLATQHTFFKRNKAKMTYADFRRRGLPIGSGPVEAACKSLVKARLCRSGMRWSRAGGQRILDLRTYVKSNRWDPFWEQYKELQIAV